jgi:hypothetical protein
MERNFGIKYLSNRINIVESNIPDVIHRYLLLNFKFINLQFLLESPYRLK